MSITSPLARPSPNGRRVGIRIVTFEACSGFTRVTARWIAQLPKATFVTRLQPLRLPARAARQLPDQSTTLWVDSSSTDDSRLRGALPIPDSCTAQQHSYSITSSALAIRVSGTVTPSVLAVFRFTMSSNFTARSMGKSAGGVPFKILSTKAAER